MLEMSNGHTLHLNDAEFRLVGLALAGKLKNGDVGAAHKLNAQLQALRLAALEEAAKKAREAVEWAKKQEEPSALPESGPAAKAAHK